MKAINRKSILMLLSAILILAISTAAYAFLGSNEGNPRTPVVFFAGHSHHDGHTVGVPEHSGGTDSYGCHNGSVPYHCH